MPIWRPGIVLDRFRCNSGRHSAPFCSIWRPFGTLLAPSLTLSWLSYGNFLWPISHVILICLYYSSGHFPEAHLEGSRCFLPLREIAWCDFLLCWIRYLIQIWHCFWYCRYIFSTFFQHRIRRWFSFMFLSNGYVPFVMCKDRGLCRRGWLTSRPEVDLTQMCCK